MQRFINAQFNELRLGTAKRCVKCEAKARVEYQVADQHPVALCIQHAQAAIGEYLRCVEVHGIQPLPDTEAMRAVEDAALVSPYQPSGTQDIEAGLRASGLTGGMEGLRKASPGLAAKIDQLARENRGE